MSGSYSRIRQDGKTRSKSIDLSNLSFPCHTPRSIAKNTPKFQEIKQNNLKNNPRMPEHENEDGIGEIFGDILKDGAEKSYIQTLVKRSFSLKRSSSVSEGYSRIHHQCDLTADDEEHTKNSNSQAKPMKKKGKILRACRRLFGF